MRRLLVLLIVAFLAPVVTAACGGSSAAGGRPQLAVTTSIFGDVVSELVGPLADVTVIMPPGAGPHDFQASAKQVVAMRDADVLVTSGLGFEGGLQKSVDAARRAGVDVYEASSAITPLRVSADGVGNGPAGAVDPHFFTDPSRMVRAARGIADHLRQAIPALDTTAFRARTDRYIARLEAADRRIAQILSVVPSARRRLVTNHEVFGYFADRYDLRIVGAVIPNMSTQTEPSARSLQKLADTIRRTRVPAIFADTSSPSRLADKLANQSGLNVRVIELYSEALGPKGSPGATYIEMMTTDARRIAAALR